MLNEKSRIQNWIYTVIATILKLIMHAKQGWEKSIENISDWFVKEKYIGRGSLKNSILLITLFVQFSKLLKLS